MECLLCVRRCLMPFVYNVLDPFDNSAKQVLLQIGREGSIEDELSRGA